MQKNKISFRRGGKVKLKNDLRKKLKDEREADRMADEFIFHYPHIGFAMIHFIIYKSKTKSGKDEYFIISDYVK